MPFGCGLGHLVLLGLDGLRLLVHALGCCLQRLCELLCLALMMPVGTEYGFAPIVDLEPAVVDHALEAMLLNLVALAVHPWPFACLQGVLDLRSAPIYQGLALSGYDKHKVPGIIGPGCFPRSAIHSCPIVQEVHLGGLKA